jgi:hypothetical protein
MTIQSVTVNLPEVIYERLQHVAASANRPLEEIVFQSIQGNLPPALEDLPSDLRQELLALRTLTNQELWAIAKTEVVSALWSHHQDLLQKKQTKGLSTEERELMCLRNTADQLVMRRSYAMALLKWRGYSLAPLKQADLLAKAKEIKARVARGEETMISHDDLKRLMLGKRVK